MSFLREAMVVSFENGFKPRKGQSDLKGEVGTDPRNMSSGKSHYLSTMTGIGKRGPKRGSRTLGSTVTMESRE